MKHLITVYSIMQNPFVKRGMYKVNFYKEQTLVNNWGEVRQIIQEYRDLENSKIFHKTIKIKVSPYYGQKYKVSELTCGPAIKID